MIRERDEVKKCYTGFVKKGLDFEIIPGTSSKVQSELSKYLFFENFKHFADFSCTVLFAKGFVKVET